MSKQTLGKVVHGAQRCAQPPSAPDVKGGLSGLSSALRMGLGQLFAVAEN